MDEIENTEFNIITKDDGIAAYIASAKKYPLLSREDERNVAIKAAAGDKAAAQTLVKSNLLLVVKIAHEYRSVFNNLSDLLQEGNIGLLKSVDKYDVSKGFRFSTYSGWWIRSLMLRYIFNNSHMIKPGSTNEQKKLFYNLRKEQKRLESIGIDADAATIAKNLDVSEEDVVEMDCRLHHDVYLDAPVSQDNDVDTFCDLMASPNEQPDVAIEKYDFNKQLRVKLDDFAGKLKNERQKYIFHNRIIADEPETLQSIGDKYFLSKERARQIESDILIKLKKHLNSFVNA